MKKIFYLFICVMAVLFAGCEPNAPEVETGIGVFSISETKQVTFSPGNLQYHSAKKRWRFAVNQYDYIGFDNVTGGRVNSFLGSYDYKNGTALANKIDLFDWSTSATYFGVSTLSVGGYSGSFVDWGTNKIGNDAPNTWRTLTYDEWYYLLYNRTNANDLVGLAQVNGVNGLILLPDNWTCPAGVTFKSGFHSELVYAYYQTFTDAEWSKLESAGAVFLPAAGYRDGSEVSHVQFYGDYWSSTPADSGIPGLLRFCWKDARMCGGVREFGRSVRLVKDL